MRPGDRVELRDLAIADYGHTDARLLDGTEYTKHHWYLTDLNGREFYYAGVKHFLKNKGEVINLRATFVRHALIFGRMKLVIAKPKLIGGDIDQLHLKW